MTDAHAPLESTVRTGPDGPELSGEAAGEGTPIVLLHGLTATRRYVVSGSRYLERHGFEVVAYDARGHGESSPAPSPEAYRYEDLIADLEAVLDHHGLERAVLAGSSMGAATAMGFALRHPERVSALVQITPAYEGRPLDDPEALARWKRLADGLRSGGVEGFLAAYEPGADERFHETVMRFTRQRLELHRHPDAVADAIEVVPPSAAFDGLDALRSLEVPTLIVASRDDSDPGHPLAVAEAYAERLPDCELAVEAEGESPLAWQGARLSKRIEAFVRERVDGQA